jgi:dihydrofolate reductase
MAHSLTEAVEMFDSSEEVFIIGGAQIYSQAMPLADRLYLTIIDKEYEGDSSFPEIDYNSWRQISCEKFERGEEFEYPFSFITLERV